MYSNVLSDRIDPKGIPQFNLTISEKQELCNEVSGQLSAAKKKCYYLTTEVLWKRGVSTSNISTDCQLLHPDGDMVYIEDLKEVFDMTEALDVYASKIATDNRKEIVSQHFSELIVHDFLQTSKIVT